MAFEQAMVLLMGAVASLQTKRRARSKPEKGKSRTNSTSPHPFSISGCRKQDADDTVSWLVAAALAVLTLHDACPPEQ